MFVSPASRAQRKRPASGVFPSYFNQLAAMLEPLAIEPAQGGTFTYVIPTTATKYVVGTFQTRLGATGRLEIREPRHPLLGLRGVTVTGTGASSQGIFIDPTLPSFASNDAAAAAYYSRLAQLGSLQTQYLPVTAPNTDFLFLPGPYGNILTTVNVFDFTWLIARPWPASTTAWNLNNEKGDTGTTDWVRFAHPCMIPISKLAATAAIGSGQERSAGVGLGGVAYVICPASWGAVKDPLSYLFRDDFMGSALNTTNLWARAQSTVGNVEINTAFAWCKAVGDGVWGDNGAHSLPSFARATGRVFQIDAYPGVLGPTVGANLIVGFSDGAGFSFTNFSHGVDFSVNAGAHALFVFENGTSRGVVGSGYTDGAIYRIRITIQNPNTGAKYEIQGGPEYAPLGGSTWTNITPGTTNSATTPLFAGFSMNTNAAVTYLGDPKIY